MAVPALIVEEYGYPECFWSVGHGQAVQMIDSLSSGRVKGFSTFFFCSDERFIEALFWTTLRIPSDKMDSAPGLIELLIYWASKIWSKKHTPMIT